MLLTSKRPQKSRIAAKGIKSSKQLSQKHEKESKREPTGARGETKGSPRARQGIQNGAKRRPKCIQGSIFALHFDTIFQQKSRSKINAKIDVKETYFVLHTCTYYRGKTHKCEKNYQK